MSIMRCWKVLLITHYSSDCFVVDSTAWVHPYIYTCMLEFLSVGNYSELPIGCPGLLLGAHNYVYCLPHN